MTRGVNSGGGRRTWLGNCLGVLGAPPPHIYIGGRERGGSQGAPEVGSESYLWFPQVAPPFLISPEKKGNPVKHFQNPQKPNRKKVTGLVRSRVEKIEKYSNSGQTMVKQWSN